MVMRSQLDMFNNAVIAYFSGNGDKLNEVDEALFYWTMLFPYITFSSMIIKP